MESSVLQVILSVSTIAQKLLENGYSFCTSVDILDGILSSFNFFYLFIFLPFSDIRIGHLVALYVKYLYYIFSTMRLHQGLPSLSLTPCHC